MVALKNYDELPAVLNPNHIMRIFGISKGAAYNLFHSEGFPTVKVGTRMFVSKDSFMKWFERQERSTNNYGKY